MTTLEGHIERITFHNPDNHFTIARFKTSKTNKPVTVLGFLPDPKPGETLEINGKWETHAKYGDQLRIESFEVILPDTIEGIRKYLTSGFIKGLSAKKVSGIIYHFGEKTLEIIEGEPHRLSEVKGIGVLTADRIATSWRRNHVVRSLMVFLREMGIKISYGARIFKEYGEDSIQIIQDNPYQVARDIPGIGFVVADAVAQNVGVPKDDPKRIEACINYLVEQAVSEGHLFIYEDELIGKCAERFQIDREMAENALVSLSEDGSVFIEQEKRVSGALMVYPKILYEAETGIANRLLARLSIPTDLKGPDSARITEEILKRLAIQLSPEQLEVLEDIFSHQVAIITGGPGTGKTTLIQSVATIFESLGKKILLAAPTGRATRRLADVTRRKTSTIHKLIGYNLATGGFEKNEDHPIDADGVIIDEASMVDIPLMFHLLKAIPMRAILILVGDAFQLPPVGPGNVLSDMIKSKKIKLFELKTIFRQELESPITVNAHRVRRGKMPFLTKMDIRSPLSGFYFIQQHEPERVVKTIVKLCTKTLPDFFNFDKLDDIQILTPMHRGEVGTINLNQVLQEALNPNSGIPGVKGMPFKSGDKVMQLKNNYQKEIFNGDIGRVTSVQAGEEVLLVDYFGRSVSYDFSELNELTLAYAITVHKSQGSEYPVTIVPIMGQHFALLNRSLLYTALTRGKKLVVLIGTSRALEIALKNNQPQKRMTKLSVRLAN